MILDHNRSIQVTDSNIVGGKARNLAKMKQDGIPIPEWIVVTTNAFKDFLKKNQLDFNNLSLESFRNDRSALKDKLTSIQAAILESPFHDSFLQNFKEETSKLHNFENTFYAVRSSVVDEDSGHASFAGQMDSFLFQKGNDSILNSIKKCYASAFNERAILYRLEKKISLENIMASVIIQKMVNSEVSGVLFTANPINGNLKQCLVSATFGLGEGIVSGECQTDEFHVDHGSYQIEKIINDKDYKVVFDTKNNRGVEKVEISDGQKNIQSLSDEKLKQLCELSIKLADLYSQPQDIEWAYTGDKLYILQTRPITSLAPPLNQDGNSIVFDNSNIQESYCGVTTPLTFSFARGAYATVYEQTMRTMGIKANVIQAHNDMLNNMLGLIKGRIYYNINNWYKGLLLLPSFKTNKDDMERMMGLQDPVEFVENTELSLNEKIKKIPSLLITLIRLLRAFSKLDNLVINFLESFTINYRSIKRNELHKKSFTELIKTTEYLQNNVLLKWETPIINDFFVMMMNGKVHRWLNSIELENPSLYQNNLLSGEEGIESTEPTKVLLRLTQIVRDIPKLTRLFETTSNQDLLGATKNSFPIFHNKCLDYIELYGDRCMGELKLETITLRTEPAFIFAVIKNYIKQTHLSENNLSSKEKELRSSSEEKVFNLIKKKHGSRKLKKFKKDLNKLRAAVKNRENMRLSRTRLFGLFRDIYLSIGQQMSLYGFLNEPRDIFYLTVDEIKALYTGVSVQKNLKPLVCARRDEFSQYELEDIPHHFTTNGFVYYLNEYKYKDDEEVQLDTDQLTGTGCYPGIVENHIKLIFTPDDELDLNGQILCTVRTDPGWAPLFPTAGGILVERGSTLSHSAVVARELGIPAIVGIKGLTTILKNNEKVKMDGAKGTIKRL